MGKLPLGRGSQRDFQQSLVTVTSACISSYAQLLPSCMLYFILHVHLTLLASSSIMCEQAP